MSAKWLRAFVYDSGVDPNRTYPIVMSIRVRYFASLRDKMGRVEETLAAEGLQTVSDVWKAVGEGKPLPEQILCAVNMEYAEPDAPVKDGDEVAFFPPVTGGVACRSN